MIRSFGPMSLFLVMVSHAFGGEQKPAEERLRIISVSGSAYLRVQPDRAHIKLAIKSFDADVQAAKQDNDARAKRVAAVLAKHNLSAPDYRTESICIQPVHKREDYQEREDQVIGYRVSNDILITIKDLSSIDDLITECIEAGANHLYGVYFESTKLREHRDQARRMAIRAAREKAELLAIEVGQKVGKARVIEELGEGESGYLPQNIISRVGGMGGGRLAGEDGADVSGTFFVGEIEIQASVAVTFDLE